MLVHDYHLVQGDGQSWCSQASKASIQTCAQIQLMETDPYNILGNLRARTANEILKAFKHVKRRETALALPIYAHHGTKDNLADIKVRRAHISEVFIGLPGFCGCCIYGIYTGGMLCGTRLPDCCRPELAATRL